MSDLIDRQAVLDEIDKRFDLAKSFKQLIKSMPSVKPEPCTDAISRQAAINAIRELTVVDEEFYDFNSALIECVDELMELPPVKPDTCEGCKEPCIMYEPKMRACEDKSEPVDVLRDEITDETLKHLLDNY